jgi:hypothetical protein
VRSLVVILALLAGCNAGAFACEQDGDCIAGSVAGTCEVGGACSFPDADCPSGKRYGEHTGDGLGGTCVPVGGSESSSSTSSSTTIASTTLDGGETTTTTASSSTAASEGGSESSTGPVMTTGDPPATFFDPFDRADSDELGNGWIEKTPDVFRLLGEQVVLASNNGGNFRDNICYRPFEESLLDVEVTLVFAFLEGLPPSGYPQLHLRVQAETVEDPTSLDSYAVFIDTADPFNLLLTVNRIAGPGFGNVMTAPVSLDESNRYRLRGRVTGIDPVMIEGYLELDTGSDWEIMAQTSLLDDDPTRLMKQGTVGLSGHDDISALALDDFGYTEL